MLRGDTRPNPHRQASIRGNASDKHFELTVIWLMIVLVVTLLIALAITQIGPAIVKLVAVGVLVVAVIVAVAKTKRFVSWLLDERPK